MGKSHKYLSLPLIPEEEFLELFPEHTQTDAHELMIARIKHEHDEREKLEQARQELLKQKQALIAENKKRKDDLANLDADLERFIDVSPLYPRCGMMEINRLCVWLGCKTDSEDFRKGVLSCTRVMCTSVAWRFVDTLTIISSI